jgi:hypothetical protein
MLSPERFSILPKHPSEHHHNGGLVLRPLCSVRDRTFPPQSRFKIFEGLARLLLLANARRPSKATFYAWTGTS